MISDVLFDSGREIERYLKTFDCYKDGGPEMDRIFALLLEMKAIQKGLDMMPSPDRVRTVTFKMEKATPVAIYEAHKVMMARHGSPVTTDAILELSTDQPAWTFSSFAELVTAPDNDHYIIVRNALPDITGLLRAGFEMVDVS
jgi:hypothetical protein